MLIFLSFSCLRLQLIKRQTLVPCSPHRQIVYHLFTHMQQQINYSMQHPNTNTKTFTEFTTTVLICLK